MDQVTSSLIQQLKRENRHPKFIVDEFIKLFDGKSWEALDRIGKFLDYRTKGFDCEIFSPYFVLAELTDEQLINAFEKYSKGNLTDTRDRCMHWPDFIQEAKLRGINVAPD